MSYMNDIIVSILCSCVSVIQFSSGFLSHHIVFSHAGTFGWMNYRHLYKKMNESICNFKSCCEYLPLLLE